MKTDTYNITFLTPCFCAGADQSRAEIRPTAIRGQLRWWFRALGGFKSLATMKLRDQEKLVFGAMAGDTGTASPLIVRTSQISASTAKKNGASPEAQVGASTGYFLFPLRTKEREVFLEKGTFSLQIQWRGDAKLWGDIQKLLSVFINIGSLGFRSRRGYGSFFCENLEFDFQKTLSVFKNCNDAILVTALPETTNAAQALDALAKWYKSWRSHGRSGKNEAEQNSPGFQYAKADHDAGYGMNRNGDTFRAALGLPIIQKCKNGTHNWDLEWNSQKRKGEGRFASPVLLRPHKTKNGKILPLVIFVDVYAWPDKHPVYLDGTQRNVSLELYDAMRQDERLELIFPPA
jgi:CRISPR type III-B/RAMP module RAMP protein Cmr1